MSSSTSAVARYAAPFLVAVAVLPGCSGVRPYPNSLEKNVFIRTEADSGSIFSKVSAAVDIFREWRIRVREQIALIFRDNCSLTPISFPRAGEPYHPTAVFFA